MYNDSGHELMRRIERLEQSNLRWKVIGFGAVSTAVVLLGVLAYSFAQREARAQQQPAQQPVAQFPVDATAKATHYANFFRVSVTPEELVLDHGLNTQTAPQQGDPVKLNQRLVISYYTAKRLMNALQSTLQQYENTYGEIELDFQKRIKNK